MNNIPPEVQKFFKEIGTKGGKSTAKKLGSEHYRNIQKKSVEARNKNKLINK